MPVTISRALGLGSVNSAYVGTFNGTTIKAMIGVLAILLPVVEVILTSTWVRSISASYWFGIPFHPEDPNACHLPDTGHPWLMLVDWPRIYLVGTLLAISALLLSYRGETMLQGVLARVGAIAAAGVALFPCNCDCYTELVPHLHYGSAGVVYTVLFYFVAHFYFKASRKAAGSYTTGRPAHSPPAWTSNAARRKHVYAFCLAGMIGSVLILATSKHLPDSMRPVLVGEAGGLLFFGLAWLTASRVAPIFTSAGIDRERIF
ncbi:hypothetical protein BLA18110_00780 [Burkholderia lata]|uniref:hypothetical protein n=1 Tax=Burkholderia lata (strain ATCC 17760 / DSM 23089 / LMG 22485 / NCIMB 9086 / R18194 / 383) TaxID=482957 RepID=UPI0014535B2B|nr:hypothetical protein [Burkholderia lata]VWC58995.1 hypothetical protein BLA18110_00780 [Burkholderia lata]